MRNLRCHGQPMTEAHVFAFLTKSQCAEGLTRLQSVITTTKCHKIRDTFQSILVGVIGEMAVIQPKPQNVTIMCKDLDEITTPEEICDILKIECGIQSLGKQNAKSMRETRSGAQTVLICFRVDDAKAVVKLGICM